MDYLFVLLFMVLAVVFVAAGLFIVHLVAPIHPSPVKTSTYECGEETIGRSWVQYNVGFYLFALLFLVFDVEAAFLYPWAIVLREVGIAGLIEVAIFVAILVFALVYAWRKGVLEWV